MIMSTTEYVFPDIQGAFLYALKSGTYHAGMRTRSFPASFSVKEGMPPVYQQSMRGTCVASAATALVEFYEDCKARLSVQFLHEMTKSVEKKWIDENLRALSKGESVDVEFGTRFSNQVAQIRLTSDMNGAESPASQALLNAFARQVKSHFGIHSGSSIRHCFSAIKEFGVCRYSLWPYANIQAGEAESCASLPPGSKEDAQKHRILTGLYILRSPNNVDEIRGILSGANNRRPMPVCVGLELYEDCDREVFSFPDVHKSDGRYVSANAMKGVHEMLVVGYEDDETAPGGGWFTVRNSWGADWGKDGYGRVPYAYVECFCVEAGTILQDMVDYAGDGYGGMFVQSPKTPRPFISGRGCVVSITLMLAAALVPVFMLVRRDVAVEDGSCSTIYECSQNKELQCKAGGETVKEYLAVSGNVRKAAEETRIAESKRRAEEAAFKARLAEDEAKRKAAEEMRLAEAKRRAEEAALKARLAEDEAKRKAAEEMRLAEAKRHAEEAERKKPVDYMFDITVNCSDEDERKALLEAMAGVVQETGFRLSEIRSEGKSSMWNSSPLYVKCVMTVSAPRNQSPNARNMLVDFLIKGCKTEDPVDWGHPSKMLCIQKISDNIRKRDNKKDSQDGVRSGFLNHLKD